MSDASACVYDIDNLSEELTITIHKDVCSFQVKTETSTAALTRLFQVLADQNLSILVVQLGDEEVNFVIEGKYAEAARRALSTTALDWTSDEDCSILTIKAENMREASGIMYRILKALVDAKANISLIGDSYNSVSCLLSTEGAERAYAFLQEEFCSDSPAAAQEE